MKRYLLLTAFIPFATGAFALTAFISENSQAICTYATGSLSVNASGGTLPYTYLWSNGATTQTINGLTAGSYTVVVTDAALDEVTANADLFSEQYALESGSSGLPWCSAPRQAFVDPMVSGMPNTWTVNGNLAEPFNFGANAWLFNTGSAGEGSFNYSVNDGNGCSGTVSGSNGMQITNWPEISVLSVDPTCATEDFGAIHIYVDGSLPASSYPTPFIGLMDASGWLTPWSAEPDQNGFASFTGLEPGAYGVCWWIGVTADELDPGDCTFDTVWVSVPNLGPTCGFITGTSYVDVDGNCQQDPGEVGIPFSPLRVQPLDEVVLTDQSGRFTIPLLNGAYTLEQMDPLVEPICPAVQPLPFTVNSDQTVQDLANISMHPPDLMASISGSVLRPGFFTNYHIAVRNNAALESGAVTVTVELDPTLEYISSIPAASTVSGSTLTWELDPFIGFGHFNTYVRVRVPVVTPLGTWVSTTVSIASTLADVVPANDTDVHTAQVVGSFDPNDKRATTSSRASEDLYVIDQDEWIDYTIRFQNTGTFAAEFVVITDTLPAELDMLTFQQGVASHPFNVLFKPGRIVEWRFDNIMLPDSTSDEPGSHGLVKFRIRPNLPLLPGTTISNTAYIFFDFNEPVITEPSVLTASVGTYILEQQNGAGLLLMPNPTSGSLIVLASDNATIGVLQVVSLDGRVVLQQRMEGPRTVLDVANLNSGLYTLNLHHVNGTVITQRFVRQ